MESTTLFSSESALLLVMFLMVAVGFWLQRFKVFKVLGPALTVIVTGIILSNLKIVPVSSPTYDALSSYCVPLSISICLLSLDLRQMEKIVKQKLDYCTGISSGKCLPDGIRVWYFIRIQD